MSRCKCRRTRNVAFITFIAEAAVILVVAFVGFWDAPSVVTLELILLTRVYKTTKPNKGIVRDWHIPDWWTVYS